MLPNDVFDSTASPLTRLWQKTTVSLRNVEMDRMDLISAPVSRMAREKSFEW